ncbi:MAG: LuxR C-terminal-related transcriptional regulator [Firmicutes bacterium]|nr:LuxR C-terminal-related transcriptional regulator [Bacillota bacterium]
MTKTTTTKNSKKQALKNAVTTQSVSVTDNKTSDLITCNNVQNMGEYIALRAIKTVLDRVSGTEKTAKNDTKKNDIIKGNSLASYGTYQFTHKLYCDLISDLNNKHLINHTITDGYDIAQTATAFLCEHIGKKLDNIASVEQLDKQGQPITIKRACFRVVNKYIMEHRQKDYKQVAIFDNGQYITPPPLWNIDKIHDLHLLNQIIKDMQLSSKEKTILSLRLKGMGYDKIAQHLSITKSTIRVYIKRIQQKASKIGLTSENAKNALKSLKIDKLQAIKASKQ